MIDYERKAGIPKKTKRYRGKIYGYWGDVTTKTEANKVLKRLRAKGCNAFKRQWTDFGRLSYEIYNRCPRRRR